MTLVANMSIWPGSSIRIPVLCSKPLLSGLFLLHTGSSNPNFSQRPSKNTKRQMVLSPLATHEARAFTTSPSPVSSPDSASNGSGGGGGPVTVKSKFFERGLGTQVMLANVSSQAKQLLFDKARRVLSEEGVEILREDLVQVRGRCYSDNKGGRQL